MAQKDKNGEQPVNIYSSGIIGRMRKIHAERGLQFLLRKTAVVLWRYMYSLLFLRFRPRRYFVYTNECYPYFYHPYNFTWDNERAVEIPIILREIEPYRGGKILEVGNVLSHYYPVDWDVLDKFERGAGIISADVSDFRPSRRYDLIISISTLEHIGFDDDCRNSRKIIDALDNLKRNCLKEGGCIIATMPLGYNTCMDELLFGGKLGFTELHYLKRIAPHKWVEVAENELGTIGYGTTYIEASTLVIAEYRSTTV
jgi:hypothetical protein